MNQAFPYRVRSARLQQGNTQEEVAKALGISKQAVSQYERGHKQPDSNTLLKLADFFQKSTGYFFRPLTTPLDQVDFRKKASLRGKKLEAVKAAILARLEPYLELEALLGEEGAFQNPLHTQSVASAEEAETAAIHLLSSWELGLNPIPNILEMLEERGIKVVEVSLDDGFDGLSTWVNGSIPVIVLNQERDLLRKRFTALHELGHLLLPFPEQMEHKSREKACNRFAGALLLPASVLEKEIGRQRKHISLSELIPIKEYHGISLAAIVYRGHDLGLLPKSWFRRFWQRRNQNGALKREDAPQYGTYQGEERAFRFDQLLAKAISEELISLSKAAELSGKSLQTLRSQSQPI